MKQMRSRFRLITLLLVCAFLLTLVLCAGSVLKTANITLSSLSSGVNYVVDKVVPAVSVSPEISSGEESTPAPSEAVTPGALFPGTDNSPNPEYNVYGL